MLLSFANKNTKKERPLAKSTAAVQSTLYSLSHSLEKTIAKISILKRNTKRKLY
nr:MAG TPA: hypothetical protein [Bacteriophage sp.]